MTKLSAKHEKTYRQSMKLGKLHGKVEQSIVENLIEVETGEIHKQVRKRSMFIYTQEVMNLADPTGLSSIAVARKALAVPALRKALADKLLTAGKATRVIAHINNDNAEEILDFASKHTYREIDFEMAKRNPKARAPDKFKPISEDEAQITITVNTKKIQRMQSVLAQKGKPASMSDAVDLALEFYLERQDPVRKAKRAMAKKVSVHRVKVKDQRAETPGTRRPFTADENHTVDARDEGRCTHVDKDGNRCNCDRWVAKHHIIRVADGGTNDPENLTTLCWFHHDLVHQLSLEIDGDMNWIR